MRRRRIIVGLALALLVLIGLAMAGFAWLDHYMSTALRGQGIDVLAQRLESEVELRQFDLALGRDIGQHGLPRALHIHRRLEARDDTPDAGETERDGRSESAASRSRDGLGPVIATNDEVPRPSWERARLMRRVNWLPFFQGKEAKSLR